MNTDEKLELIRDIRDNVLTINGSINNIRAQVSIIDQCLTEIGEQLKRLER